MKKKKDNWLTWVNPETKVSMPLPANRKARRAMKKMHNLDQVPPPLFYPFHLRGGSHAGG